jgi:hypothetical protein
MSFLGDISEIGVADLLYMLALRQQSGRLSVIADGQDISLLIDQGRMVHVTSSNSALRLGRTLIRMEFLTADRLRDALRRQEQLGGTKPLGSILIDDGYITEAELQLCVEEQCIEVLSHVISASSGNFVFHAGSRVPPGTEIVSLNSDRILLEAARRTDTLAALRGMLPEDSAPLMLSPDIDDNADTLTDTEVLVASALYDRPANLRGLSSSIPVDNATLWQTVIGMRARGWIVDARRSISPELEPLPTIHVAAD